jgi:dTDP-4-amino-4,6-dideoxygalactose transaminase
MRAARDGHVRPGRCGVSGLAASFAAAGLHPDSIRYGYRPLYHRAIFTGYTSTCPNAEALAATTFQVPVHPGMSEAALEWIADRVRALTEESRA